MEILEDLKSKFKEGQRFTYKESGYHFTKLNKLVDEGYLNKIKDKNRNYYYFGVPDLIDNNSNLNLQLDNNNASNNIMLLKSQLSSLKNRVVSYVNGDNAYTDINSCVGIYKISIVDEPNTLYIGKTTRPFEERWEEHREQLLNNTHHCEKLQNYFNKYNKDLTKFKFEIVQQVEKNEEFIDNRERYWVDYYGKNANYNLLNTVRPSLHL